MSISVGGSVVPSTFGGHVQFHRQQTKPNGAGSLVRYGEQWYEWNAPGCIAADWDWWVTQHQRGTAMAFALPTDDSGGARGSITFTSGYLWRPEYERVEGGVYLDVRIQIHNLTPIQSW
jgi:hypothetical protein